MSEQARTLFDKVWQAHRVRGEHAQALSALEAAVALGGPLEGELRSELARLRAESR